MKKKRKKTSVAAKIVKGLREGLRWARGQRRLRVTTLKKTPSGEVYREVGYKYREEV
jgi:hypothetical protein